MNQRWRDGEGERYMLINIIPKQKQKQYTEDVFLQASVCWMTACTLSFLNRPRKTSYPD